MERIILHMDLDSFYASAEAARDPNLQGKPIAVCIYSGRTPDSGAVSTSNYPARKLGIKSGMPIAFAKKVPGAEDVVFLPADKEYYQAVSERVMEILSENPGRMQQVSIDEAYLDVTQSCKGKWKTAKEIASKIKKEIFEAEAITATVGIGPNKFMAKMASKHKKPDGLTIIKTGEVIDFLKNIPTIELHGIGPKSADTLKELGAETAGELQDIPLTKLREHFSEKKATLIFERCRGLDNSIVEQKEKKQLGRMGTLPKDTKDPKEMLQKIESLSEDLDARIKKNSIAYRTVTLVLIDKDLATHTKSQTIEQSDNIGKAVRVCGDLLSEFTRENPHMIIRRIGLRVSNLNRIGQERAQRTLDDFSL